jgi:hypothetical protein
MRVDTNGPDAVNDACVLSVRLEVVDGGKLEEYHVEIHRRRRSSSINPDAGHHLPASADISVSESAVQRLVAEPANPNCVTQPQRGDRVPFRLAVTHSAPLFGNRRSPDHLPPEAPRFPARLVVGHCRAQRRPESGTRDDLTAASDLHQTMR